MKKSNIFIGKYLYYIWFTIMVLWYNVSHFHYYFIMLTKKSLENFIKTLQYSWKIIENSQLDRIWGPLIAAFVWSEEQGWVIKVVLYNMGVSQQMQVARAYFPNKSITQGYPTIFWFLQTNHTQIFRQNPYSVRANKQKTDVYTKPKIKAGKFEPATLKRLR